MSQLVQSRWRYTSRSQQAPTFLKSLAIEFHSSPDKDFWKANSQVLPELYEEMQERARERMHELHPDKGGDPDQFRHFLKAYKSAQKNFARYLPGSGISTVPSTVKFTPIEQVRKDKKAARARARRKANRTKFRAQCKARYWRLKAEGKISSNIEAKQRYRKRHRRKCINAMNRYRKAHPEKVKQWKENYKLSAKKRGVKRKPSTSREARTIPGTPAYEKRRAYVKALYERRKAILNARRRVKNPVPKERNNKGRFVPFLEIAA